MSECSQQDIENAQHTLKSDKKSIEKYKIFAELSDHNSKRAIPWHCFVSVNDTSRFKESGDELFSFVKNIEGEDITFIVILESIFGDRNPQDDIDEFRKVALCPFGDEEELCDAGIICKKELHEPGVRNNRTQQYGQGINGYFGDEVKEEIKQEHKAARSALFYSRIRKMFGFSIVAIIAYLWYQKLYATA